MEKEISDIIQDQIDSEEICDYCGCLMKLNKIRKKRNRFDKGHEMYVCSCGNQYRKRTGNEILRDIGERD